MKELFVEKVVDETTDFLDNNQRLKLKEILIEICIYYRIEKLEQSQKEEMQRNNEDILNKFISAKEIISTGMRVGKITRLNISDMNFQERSCIVLGKGNSEREVYFSAKSKK